MSVDVQYGLFWSSVTYCFVTEWDEGYKIADINPINHVIFYLDDRLWDCNITTQSYQDGK